MSHQINSSAFTKSMHAEAEAEGWWLSTRDDGYLEIQRYDADPKERFTSDAAALEHVAARARSGSYLHQLAMHLDGTLA